MPVFQNSTNHSISAVINGSRRTIKPGQIINGPDSLAAINGMVIVKPENKTIIAEKNNLNFQFANNSSSPPLSQEMKRLTMQPPDPNITSNYTHDIDKEIKYLEYMKSLGENPHVTVAILTKNFLHLIKDCCDSLFNMVRYKNVTILIADTGTDDPHVRTYYESLPEKCRAKGWRYKFVQLPDYNFSKNYNEIVKKHVDTEYVLIQNNDTVALNDYITEMMGTAILRRVGSTGCRMFYRDGAIQHDGQFFYNSPGRMFGGCGHVHLRQRKEQIPATDHFTHMVDGNTAAGALMRTKDFIAIGGFDEGYKDIFQDVDMMMKVAPFLNKFNYCNRIANIIHLDNASRFGKGPDAKRNAAMWEDTHYIKARINQNGWQRAKDPKPVDFSIITLVYNLDKYKVFCDSIKSQIGNHTIEVIGIPNFYNLFDSAYKGLNTAADTANGTHIIFCHDDIVVPNDWLYRIKRNIIELDSLNVNWGVLGPAGVLMDGDNSPYFLLDQDGQPSWKHNSRLLHDAPRYEVASLDELCLITKKSNKLRFSDSQLSGFHFYGVNLCLEAQLKGLKTYAIDAYCHHRSGGNMDTIEEYKKYEDGAKAFNNWAKIRGVQKWRSTTAFYVSGHLHLFIKSPK